MTDEKETDKKETDKKETDEKETDEKETDEKGKQTKKETRYSLYHPDYLAQNKMCGICDKVILSTEEYIVGSCPYEDTFHERCVLLWIKEKKDSMVRCPKCREKFSY